LDLRVLMVARPSQASVAGGSEARASPELNKGVEPAGEKAKDCAPEKGAAKPSAATSSKGEALEGSVDPQV